MGYNALDNIQLAIDLREQMILEKEDLRSTMEYNEATGGENWSIDDSSRIDQEMNVIERTIQQLTRYINIGGEN